MNISSDIINLLEKSRRFFVEMNESDLVLSECLSTLQIYRLNDLVIEHIKRTFVSKNV